MKKTRTTMKLRQRDKDMLTEYRFNYSKSGPNRFAALAAGEAAMMGRMTLREVREALAAAKARGANAPATTPTVTELESLARLLEKEEAAAPAKEQSLEETAEQDAEADGGARRGSRRSPRPRGPRRR